MQLQYPPLTLSRTSMLSSAALLGFAIILVLFPHWTVDDAYITLRYAQNLANHGQLTWNLGMFPVEGYTGIVWPLLAAGAMWAHLPPVLVLNLVGLLSALAMVELVERVLVTLGTDESRRLLARLILVGGGWWAMHAGSGLETTLYTALCVASVLAWLQHRPWTPLLCLLTALTRPEGVLLAVVLAAADAWRMRERPGLWRLVGAWLGGFVLPGALYFAWRWSYYGQLLPNPFYVKSASGVTSWLHVANFIVTTVLFPLLAWRASRPTLVRLHPQRVLVSGLGGMLAVLLVFYGQSELLMNYGNRFFMPLLPIIIVGLAATWGELRWSKWLVCYGLLSGVFTIGAAVNAYNYALMMQSEHAAAAAWISEHVPADQTLAVIVDAGLVPYETGMRTVDVGALNDPVLAHEQDAQARADYVLNQEPAVVLLATGELGIVAAEATRTALLADPRWQATYYLAQEFRRLHSFEYHQQVWVRDGTSLR